MPRIAPFTVALPTLREDKGRPSAIARWDERGSQAGIFVRHSFVVLLGRKLSPPIIMKQAFLPTLALAFLAASEYVWPSPYDEIEDYLSLQGGYLRRGFIDGEAPLDLFSSKLITQRRDHLWLRY